VIGALAKSCRKKFLSSNLYTVDETDHRQLKKNGSGATGTGDELTVKYVHVTHDVTSCSPRGIAGAMRRIQVTVRHIEFPRFGTLGVLPINQLQLDLRN